MKTRKQYLNKECTHDEYYRQFSNESIIEKVSSIIGKERISNSSDENFKDIPLSEWDGLYPYVIEMCGRSIEKASISGGVSLSDCVCIAKSSARIIKERMKCLEE